jgi:hypothetical protein
MWTRNGPSLARGACTCLHRALISSALTPQSGIGPGVGVAGEVPGMGSRVRTTRFAKPGRKRKSQHGDGLGGGNSPGQKAAALSRSKGPRGARPPLFGGGVGPTGNSWVKPEGDLVRPKASSRPCYRPRTTVDPAWPHGADHHWGKEGEPSTDSAVSTETV